MALVLVTAAQPVVSLAEAKRHVRADDFTDDDSYIESLILATQDNIGGPAGWLGVSLGQSTWEMRIDEFPNGAISIPMPPLQAVGGIEYVDVDGAAQALTGFRVFGVGGAGYVLPAFNSEWPETRDEPEVVRVTFTAGYATTPQSIKHAILLTVGHLYENREDVGAKMDEIPNSAKALLMPHRHWSG